MLVDGGLAAALLAVVVALAAALDARPVPGATAAGGVGTLLLELLLSRRRERVRVLWRRPTTKAVTVVVGSAAAVGVAAVAPGVGLSALGGGLATYLLVLAVVAVARGRP
jgi:peptidoglycan/LPS O-acetylase OafA/YrhL